MAEHSIGEIARRAGLAASAIRYDEREGLLPVPARRSGRRVYGEEILDRLALIELAQGAGFRIAEIKKLLAGVKGRTPPGVRWRGLAAQKHADLERRIDELERMKRVLEVLQACECPTLADCSRAMRERREGCKAPRAWARARSGPAYRAARVGGGGRRGLT